MKNVEEVKNILLATYKDELEPYAPNYCLEVQDNLSPDCIHVSLHAKELGLHENLSLLWMIQHNPQAEDNWGHKIYANSLIINTQKITQKCIF